MGPAGDEGAHLDPRRDGKGLVVAVAVGDGGWGEAKQGSLGRRQLQDVRARLRQNSRSVQVQVEEPPQSLQGMKFGFFFFFLLELDFFFRR